MLCHFTQIEFSLLQPHSGYHQIAKNLASPRHINDLPPCKEKEIDMTSVLVHLHRAIDSSTITAG
jgi:hypothetical protein